VKPKLTGIKYSQSAFHHIPDTSRRLFTIEGHRFNMFYSNKTFLLYSTFFIILCWIHWCN